MDSFLNLYKKIKGNPILGYKFEPKRQQGRSVKKLNRLRNEFIHFMPRGWSIELSGLPCIFRDCLDVLSELGETNAMRWECETQFALFKSFIEQAAEVTQVDGSH